MQIHAIHIDHFLSFDIFTWDGLDPRLNAIVGPNGAGKTNLLHALRVVRDVLSLERTQAQARWVGAEHRGKDADTITIMLDLEFTTAWEQQLLCTFLAAALCDQQETRNILSAAARQNLDDHRMRRFATWVHERLHPANISWLFRGRLIVTRAGGDGWQCRYEASPETPRFSLNLTNWGTLAGNAEHIGQIGTQNSGPLFVAWRSSLTADERLRLDNGLSGVAPEADFPVPDFSHLPYWVSSQGGVGLQIGSSQQYVDLETLATHRAFAAAVQPSSDKQRSGFGARFVFQRLLEQGLVFTDNARLPPQDTFTPYGLLTAPLDLSSGKDLACFLFRKKNGDARDRQQYAAIEKLFWRMTRRRFDVVAGAVYAGGLRSPQLGIGEEPQAQPTIAVELVTSGLWNDIPLEISGAGIAEALFLSAVVAGSTGQVVVLDEPALNLHPTMQATLLNEVLTLTRRPEDERNQFLVNTHTPTLVPPDAIDRVSRFTLQDRRHTIRQALDDGRIDDDLLSDLRKLLRGNIAARALLFSRAVILFEGETELGALPLWCADLVGQDIELYDVHGKGGFAAPLKLIQHFEIPWAIVGDGEFLWDRRQEGHSRGPQHHIQAVLHVCNIPLPSLPSDPVNNADDFVHWRQDLQALGIFTLASSVGEGFERAIQPEISAELWAEAKEECGSNKVAFARFIAERHDRPKKVDTLMQRVIRYLRAQRVDVTLPDEDSLPSSGTH